MKANESKAARFERAQDFSSGCLQGYVTASYKDLVAIFGEPDEGDGDKTSTEWVVRDTETGTLIAIYDWKETELYEPGYPTVKSFRARSSYRWHIGGQDEAKALIPQLSSFIRLAASQR